jgi:peptidoglycan-N-acetylglucosamine deacetylase
VRQTSLAMALLLSWIVVPTACPEELAITFDDLPLNGELAPGLTRTDIVKHVVAILDQRKLSPVYGFVNGKRFENIPDGAEAMRQWINAGERIGNHTYAHTDLTDRTTADFLQDLRANEPVLERLDPDNRWHWFRYPYLHEGNTLAKRDQVRAALEQQGYRIAQVTLDWEDYLWNSAYAHCLARHDELAVKWLHDSYLDFASRYIDADRAMAQAVVGQPVSHVLLLHLGSYSEVILPELIELLRRKGFSFVSLEQAQRDPIYASNPNFATDNGGTLLEQWLDARRLKYPQAPEKPYKKLATICTQ